MRETDFTNTLQRLAIRTGEAALAEAEHKAEKARLESEQARIMLEATKDAVDKCALDGFMPRGGKTS